LQEKGPQADIRRHAQEWLEANTERVAEWLAAAQTTANIPAIDPTTILPEAAETASTLPDFPLRVVTQRFEPLVIYENQQYQGFSIELWDAIANELDLAYDLVGVNSIAKLLDEVQRGAADIAVAGVGITSQGEEVFDFSYPYYEAGLQVMVPHHSGEVGQLLTVMGGSVEIASPVLWHRVFHFNPAGGGAFAVVF
jgi:ABC-type amino acid transport substrate-binding protein